jgi:hypothetical protein
MTTAPGGSRHHRATRATYKGEYLMFEIDTGDSGASLGPWVAWSSNGSAEKGFPPRSWVLRGKDDNGSKMEHVIPAFAQGCVMDIDTLKLGWEKDGAKGMAPERRWNPSISQATQRPDESKKATGAFCWSKALSVRVAISKDQAATWEQGSFAAYEGFTVLAKQITAQWPTQSQNGKLLPLVKMTGVEKRDLPNGSANIPTLVIDRWVERPDCLKAAAPVIAAQPAPAPQPAPQAAPVQQAVPADAEW